MKATPSSPAGEACNEKAPATRLAISAWEEETFTLPLAEARTGRFAAWWLDWENIEAIGAADDASRFKPDFQQTEPAGSCR